MPACDFDDRLPTYLAEELDETETLLVERHIGICDRCQSRLEALTSDPALDRWRRLSDTPSERLPQPLFLGQFRTLHYRSDSRPRSAKAAVAAPTIPGYDIDCELGRGGMGVVYKAIERSLRRTVALKMILAGAHASDRELDLFRAEAGVVATLEHPHIIRIHAIGDHDGLPFLSLEYMSGGSLAQKLAGLP